MTGGNYCGGMFHSTAHQADNVRIYSIAYLMCTIGKLLSGAIMLLASLSDIQLSFLFPAEPPSF